MWDNQILLLFVYFNILDSVNFWYIFSLHLKNCTAVFNLIIHPFKRLWLLLCPFLWNLGSFLTQQKILFCESTFKKIINGSLAFLIILVCLNSTVFICPIYNYLLHVVKSPYFWPLIAYIFYYKFGKKGK